MAASSSNSKLNLIPLMDHMSAVHERLTTLKGIVVENRRREKQAREGKSSRRKVNDTPRLAKRVTPAVGRTDGSVGSSRTVARLEASLVVDEGKGYLEQRYVHIALEEFGLERLYLEQPKRGLGVIGKECCYHKVATIFVNVGTIVDIMGGELYVCPNDRDQPSQWVDHKLTFKVPPPNVLTDVRRNVETHIQHILFPTET